MATGADIKRFRSGLGYAYWRDWTNRSHNGLLDCTARQALFEDIQFLAVDFSEIS